MSGLILIPAIFFGLIIGGPSLYMGLYFSGVPERTQLIIEGIVVGAGLLFGCSCVACCIHCGDKPESIEAACPCAIGSFIAATGLCSILITLIGWCAWSIKC